MSINKSFTWVSLVIPDFYTGYSYIVLFFAVYINTVNRTKAIDAYIYSQKKDVKFVLLSEYWKITQFCNWKMLLIICRTSFQNH